MKTTVGVKNSHNAPDVILSRAQVALARSQRLVASWLPPKTAEEIKSDEDRQREEDELFTPVPEKLGLGATVPSPTAAASGGTIPSMAIDKLRTQLLLRGKKQQQTHPQQSTNSPPSSSSWIQSKAGNPRQPEKRKQTGEGKSEKVEDEDDEEDESRSSAISRKKNRKREGEEKKKKKRKIESIKTSHGSPNPSINNIDNEAVSDTDPERRSQTQAGVLAVPSSTHSSTYSFLDEILASRAKKRKKKKKQEK